MAWHLYVVPTTGAGIKTDGYRPKYINGLGVAWGAIGYGFQPVSLVAADTSPAQDASIISNADALKVPDALDTNPSAGGVTTAQTFLESIIVPAGWVTTALTWRQIVRTVAGLFLFVQRFSGLLPGVLLMDGVTITLNTQFNQLAAGTRTALLGTATSFGYDSSSLAGTSTLRQILKVMSDQWGTSPIQLGGLGL